MNETSFEDRLINRLDIEVRITKRKINDNVHDTF